MISIAYVLMYIGAAVIGFMVGVAIGHFIIWLIDRFF